MRTPEATPLKERYRRGFRTWRVRMSMRVTTPRSLPSAATGRSLILSSAMMVAASERESSGPTVRTSVVLQRLLPVLVPVAQGDETPQDVEEARSFDVGVLEDQISLGEYPDQPIPFDDRGSREVRLGEELDHVLYCLLRVERGPVGLHYVPYPQLPDVLLVHEIPLVNNPTTHGTPLIVNGRAV
jgi:hypothetical protein